MNLQKERILLRKFLRDRLANWAFETNYSAPIGCWNCDEIYSINIQKGTNVPEYLVGEKPACRNCGCDSLKPHIEYLTEKEIMKDLVLHHRMTQMEEKEPEGPKHDHKHFG